MLRFDISLFSYVLCITDHFRIWYRWWWNNSGMFTISTGSFVFVIRNIDRLNEKINIGKSIDWYSNETQRWERRILFDLINWRKREQQNRVNRRKFYLHWPMDLLGWWWQMSSQKIRLTVRKKKKKDEKRHISIISLVIIFVYLSSKCL